MLPRLDRGSGRKRPLRHLVSCSQELADVPRMGSCFWSVTTISFVWSSLVCHYGLPATPEWGSWVIAQLEQQKRIQTSSLDLGSHGVAVKATRKHLLALLSKGLRNRRIAFPDQNGPVEWPRFILPRDCLIPPEKPHPLNALRMDDPRNLRTNIR